MPDAARPPRTDIDRFIEEAARSGGAERANAQPFLDGLADVLGVARPAFTTGDPRADAYVFERPVAFQDGRQTKGFIDLYKRGAFVLETKQGADAKRTAGGRPLRQGHGRRGTRAWEATMDAARNQAETYARNLEAAEPPPPFVVVCDVGFCLDLYADFSGAGRLYRPFPDAASHRLRLGDLRDPAVRATLAAVFEDPLSLDPARRQARVTVALAGRLAALAQSLDGAADADGAPMDAEAVAGFLSRALFALFAEDAGLIPERAFTGLLGAYADDLAPLPHALSDFFRKMDAGGYVGEVRASVRRFNPDDALVNIALDDAFHLGVLSSRVHVEWALAAGGRLGVGNDPRYNKTRSFEPFPFPEAAGAHTEEIRRLGEAIDRHRKARQAATGVGLTDLYNAVEALRAGRALTAKEARAADDGLAHTLLDLHRRLDRAVLAAYGWADLDPEAASFRAAVLGRLVALNAERRAEEEAGTVRYLRPAFQAPGASGQGGLDLRAAPRPEAEAPEAAARPWPDTLAARAVAVRQAVAAGAPTAEAVAARFPGARRADVEEVLDALAELGLVHVAGGAVAA